MYFVSAVLVSAVASGALPLGFDRGFVQSEFRKELLPQHGLRAVDIFKDLPQSVDWRTDANGNNIATKLRNQHIPNYCGACWSFAATSALSDRINIASKKIRQTGLSMQVILNCDKYDGGCHGGDPLTAYQFIHESGGIPDETCQIYVAEGHDTGRECKAIDVCMTCDEKGCYPQDSYPVWDVEEYGLVNGTEAMMAELQRGPITCSIAVTDEFFSLADFEIFEDRTGDQDLDHSISVVGYGEDFWIIRNSWGSYWGESGFARIVKGKNNLGIESNCQFAVPANKGEPSMRKLPASSFRSSLDVWSHQSCRRERNDWSQAKVISVSSSLQEGEVLPESYDIRNIQGVQSYWTEDKNQNTPGYCGSCWAEAVTSALSDRLALMNKGVFPPINLSPQVLINCKYGGDCKGGNPAVAYAKIHKYGIPDETCQAYRADNENACDPIHVCEECFAGETPETFWPGTCHLVEAKKYKKYYVSEYGKVEGGVESMKIEIFKRGPITCGIFASTNFMLYKGGYVIEEAAPNTWTVNHEVVVSGWGKDAANEEFWIVRNSWGTAFGENGWFKIRMGGSKNLNIESDCSFGVPSLHTPADDLFWEIDTE
jgi:cathepsin X